MHPFTILTVGITPRYASKYESKTSACKGLFSSPFGAGTSVIILSKISTTPTPVLPDAIIALDASIPITSSISCLVFSGSACGKSTLFNTGIISKSLSRAR